METARRMGLLEGVDEAVKREMNKIKVEVKNSGKWTEVDKDDEFNSKIDKL